MFWEVTGEELQIVSGVETRGGSSVLPVAVRGLGTHPEVRGSRVCPVFTDVGATTSRDAPRSNVGVQHCQMGYGEMLTQRPVKNPSAQFKEIQATSLQ